MMSEFERRALGYAINFFYFLILLSYNFFWGMILRLDWEGKYDLVLYSFWGRNGNWIVFCSATVVVFFLHTFLGLWKIESKSGWFFREDNLTEREKFLSYKATSRTLTVFVIVSYTLVMFCLFTPVSSVLYESTFRLHDGVIGGVIILLAFGVVKSLVLSVYLRNERLRNSPSDQESPV